MAPDIASASVGDMSTAVKDYSVPTDRTDGAADGGPVPWWNERFSQYLGYYFKIPELKSTIDTKSKWVTGKGVKADKKTMKIMNSWVGWGKDTINQLIENMVKTYYVGGDFFAEKVVEGNKIINLKPLDPDTIGIVVNDQGILEHYLQRSKSQKVPNREIDRDNMFHLAKNRFADQIHGTSIITAIEEIILMRNESMQDMKIVFHRYVKPLWIWQLDTDDTTKIAAFKTKADLTVANSENIYIPKGAAEAERVSVPQFSTLDPLPWIRDLTDYFYQATNVPDVVVGSAKQTTEASAKILFLAFEESVRNDQIFIMENFKSQLDLEIKLEFPTPIEADLLRDEKKDGKDKASEPNDTKAELEGKK